MVFGILATAGAIWFLFGGVGFIVATVQSRRIKALEDRVGKLIQRLEAGDLHEDEPARLQTGETSKKSTPEKTRPKEKTRTVLSPLAAKQAETKTSQVAPAGPPIKPPARKTPGFAARVIENFKTNWIIWIGALSLALGGVFFVQYGIERGILGPKARVASSLVFGIALFAGAGWLRRKSPQTKSGLLTVDTALAAGGIASLFAGTISAHVLYGLTNGPFAFVSIAAVAWLALGAGLVFGPVLAVIGLLGAFVTPALIQSDAPSEMMYLYFLLVLAASLGVERFQKWIWLSALAVTGALVWAVLLYDALPRGIWFGPYMGGILVLALSIPAFGVAPVWGDKTMLGQESLRKISQHYPTVLAVVTAIAATFLLWASGMDTAVISYQVAMITLLVLLAGAVFTLHRAANLDQLAPVFGLGFIALLAVSTHFENSARYAVAPRFTFTALVVAFGILTCLIGAIWRAERSPRPMYWVWIAAAAPVAGLGTLWLVWHEIAALPARHWLVAGGALVVLQIGNARYFHRTRERLPFGSDVFAASALLLMLTMIYAYTSGWHLTLAVAALALVTTIVESRFRFHYTGRLATALVALVTLCLVVWPGLQWAVEAPFIELIQVFAGSIVAFALGILVTQKAARLVNLVVFETAGSALIGVLLCVLGARYLGATQEQNLTSIALYGLIWGMLAIGQFIRSRQPDAMQRFRLIMGNCYTIAFAMALAINLTSFNPLFRGTVQGPILFDTLAFAFLASAVVGYVLMSLREIRPLFPRWLRNALPGGLAFLYLGLEIRRYWQGDDLSGHGVTDNELYSYTVLMLVCTLAMITLSLLRNSVILRRIGLAFIAVTAAKVFLLDMAGLAGLARATSFVALGLILAGIAWVYQRFTIKVAPQDDTDTKSE